MSEGPVASLRVQAVVSRTRDNEAMASQLETRRAMAGPSGGTMFWIGVPCNLLRRFLTI